MHETVRPDPVTHLANLTRVARLIRGRTVETSHRSGTPHLGSCLSVIDLLVALYFDVLRIDPARPHDEARDRFILSKGHGAPALFQVLAQRGFFELQALEDYGRDGGLFGEHPPAPGPVPGIEAATGSLGHGLPLALGMALGARLRGLPSRVYAVLSDGECNEGSVWEAAMMATAQRADNLCALVDFNGWQATGRSREVLALDPLGDKWRAFGWHVLEINGHDLAAILAALAEAQATAGRPTAVIAHTIKGRGVSFMEDDNNWHYRIPSASEVAQAWQELGGRP